MPKNSSAWVLLIFLNDKDLSFSNVEENVNFRLSFVCLSDKLKAFYLSVSIYMKIVSRIFNILQFNKRGVDAAAPPPLSIYIYLFIGTNVADAPESSFFFFFFPRWWFCAWLGNSAMCVFYNKNVCVWPNAKVFESRVF